MAEKIFPATAAATIKQQGTQPYLRWRLAKDALVRYGVIVGGLGIIAAIALIFFYLLYVVFPLFLPARITGAGTYPVPAPESGRTLLLALEEQSQIAARFTDTGGVVFFEAGTGKTLSVRQVPIPQGVSVTGFAQGAPAGEGTVIYGLSDGRAMVVRQNYQISYANNARVITPSLSYPLGEAPLVIDQNGAALEKLAVSAGDDGVIIAAKTVGGGQAPGRILLTTLTREKSLFADEAALNRTDAALELLPAGLMQILIDKDGRYLYLIDQEGQLSVFDINGKDAPALLQNQHIIRAGEKITAAAFLNGDLSLLIGDSNGYVTQWSRVRDNLNRQSVEKIRQFKLSDRAVAAIAAEQRRKGFIALDAAGTGAVYHTTSERELIKTAIADSAPVALALAPRANALVVQGTDDKVRFWRIANEHPEVSLKSLWQKVWYESYARPGYVWQSSSASSDFEPKYSLVPLVFGTLKAAFYAMMVAVPLALMGAIYTAYFMSPKMRQLVKPSIELMGALPTVILGFLAGLWLAPFTEKHLAGLLLFFMGLPISVMLASYGWQSAPARIRRLMPEGWEAALLAPVIIVLAGIAFSVSVPLESFLFEGSLRDWLPQKAGVDYDQRNALIVGMAMGFAVIPTIFTIAEDAIFSVPKHLTIGSLALGATPWQTLSKVVLLTASPGIFSAIMIGFGRAIGETMIVLMATGNTPVMDFSLFQGLRTLAANIAVEMPESEVNGTHYRILFLTALVLFMFTFVFNTLAEVVRQRLREKYSSL